MQALAALLERSGCDVRTAINSLQLLARGAAASTAAVAPGHTRLRISAADVRRAGSLGLKDAALAPLAVLGEVLSAQGGRPGAAAARLLAMASATAGTDGRSMGAGAAGAAAAARRLLRQHYALLLELGEHELVRVVELGEHDVLLSQHTTAHSTAMHRLCGPSCARTVCCSQVANALSEALPGLVGVDVDLSSAAGAAHALADADALLGSAGPSGWGARGAAPACLLAAARAALRGGGALAASGTLAWPRAQVCGWWVVGGGHACSGIQHSASQHSTAPSPSPPPTHTTSITTTACLCALAHSQGRVRAP